MLRQCLETKRLERQRRCADLTRLAKAWRSKAQTSNGIEWKSEARAMYARCSFDKQRQSMV
nr:MAG TPA: hypothetical protein [Caudoviricetes sp.]